ncbi:MAG: PAS domain-containing protein [Bacteroidota bacterium]
MIYKQEEMDSLLQSIEGIVWEADINLGLFTFISDQIKPILGFSPGDWLGQPGFWEPCIHPDDREMAAGYKELLNGQLKSHSFQYRIIKADGHIAWIRDNVSIINRDSKPFLLRGIMLDITITERLLEMERLEGHILRLNSDLTTPLAEVLTAYLSGLEALFPQMLSCIHQVKNGHLVAGVSPSLNGSYLDTLAGIRIGENEGSCGTAAFLKQQVIVGNITTDAKWEKWRAVALSYQLQACWSNPVIDADGEVMATVSMYYKEPKMPGDEELKVMERATALLRVILENRHKTDIISEGNLLMLQSQELAHFGNWHWDIQQDVVSWSPALYTIYGLNLNNFKATFSGYQELLHPEDRVRIYQIIENVLKSKQDAEFEERIIRPDGEVRHLRSWAKLKSDQYGQPVKMIGACLDVTEKVNHIAAIEVRNRQLTEIAWVQSHIIRSPLAKIMGLVDLIKNSSTDEAEKDQLLDYLLSSAQELDEQIRRICKEIES